MLESNAITKIQSMILIIVVIIAFISGSTVYLLINQENHNSDIIKIGVLADLDMVIGEAIWEGVFLGSEQINEAGGILGKKIEVIGEDTDQESENDPAKVSTALTRLITFDKVDFVIGDSGGPEIGNVIQDIIAEHKIIFLSVSGGSDIFSERVLGNYDRFKYWFRVNPPNSTILLDSFLESILTLREYTGFNRIGYLTIDLPFSSIYKEGFDSILPEKYGFDIRYRGSYPPGTIDFSSYFARMEESNIDILLTLILGPEGIPFIREWSDRQSPFVLWGINVVSQDNQYWNQTQGGCNTESIMCSPIVAGYPITEVTLPVLEAYFERWGHTPSVAGAAGYDSLAIILYNAIKRANSTETGTLVNALENTFINKTEGIMAFTSSHDLLIESGKGAEILFFQWQSNGTRVPVYPKRIMEEAGVTYTFPDWPGPWDNIN